MSVTRAWYQLHNPFRIKLLRYIHYSIRIKYKEN